ncbi:hypothetical protein D4R78_01905 [bacterium]|nr:MAG: hypothetical protein D4R78_01905 [bacterium]
MVNSNLREIDVLILCGGLGRRLSSCVNDRPKVLAEISGIPFLEILLDNILQSNFKNIILSVGYLKEQIKEHFCCRPNYRIKFSEEKALLGTGGAVKKARALIKSNSFVVMNGDSICKIDFNEFYDFHMTKKAILSIALVHSETCEDYGLVTLDALNKIKSFREKVSEGKTGLISVGIYLMQKDIFTYMPHEKYFSLEQDFFPKIIKERCYGFVSNGKLIDIGTPARYKRAVNLLRKDEYYD